MALTYTSLVEKILSYAERTDDATRNMVPTFISNAELRMTSDCISIGFLRYVTGSFDANETIRSVLPKPGRWRRTVSFNYGRGADNDDRTPLYKRRYDYCRMYWPDARLLGTPLYYSDYGFSHFLIAPTPDLAYPFEIGYLELPEPLTEQNQTNWLTNYEADVLLSACMVETMLFLKNFEYADKWELKYQDGKARINREDVLRKIDGQSNADAD